MIEGETCTFHPFNGSIKPMKNVQTVTVAYATDIEQGHTYIRHVDHSLGFTASMRHSILCSNQCCSKNLMIDDVPKILDVKGTSTQSIIFLDQNVNLDVKSHSPVPYLHIGYPTDEEMIEYQ